MGLLKSAIRDDNPVIVMEDKTLHALKGSIPEEGYVVPIGSADVKKEGTDVTVIAPSRMVHESLKAAGKMARKASTLKLLIFYQFRPGTRRRSFIQLQRPIGKLSPMKA